MRRDPRSGYALLAALVIIVLAATFALALIGAVHSLHLVTLADADSQRASRLTAEAAGAVLARLRWAPQQASGSLAGRDLSPREQWTAEWETVAPGPSSLWPRRRARVAAAASAARCVRRETVEIRVEDWAVGVSCSGDADVAAEFRVAGSGFYVGGSLRGREYVSFAAGEAGVTADGRPADGARGDECPVAAAHAGAGIFAGGAEVHDPPAGVYPEDGDPHAGVAPATAWVTGPSAEVLAAAQDGGSPAGDALQDGSLHLDAIGAADPAELIAGRCLVIAGRDEVTIEGVAGEAAGRLLVIITGDAVVGQPGTRVELHGGLVVRGRLRVRSELSLEGSLHAGSLDVDAPVTISLPRGWREQALPGAARPVVVELDT
jgi:hypothetical protein